MRPAKSVDGGVNSFVISKISLIKDGSSFNWIATVPCLYFSVTGEIRLITAVVGLGDDGKSASPSKAFENEDLPALNAPNNAIVNERLFKLFFFKDRKSTRLNSSHVAISYA